MDQPLAQSLIVGDHERLVRYSPQPATIAARAGILDIVQRYMAHEDAFWLPKTPADLEGSGVVPDGSTTPFIEAIDQVREELFIASQNDRDGNPRINKIVGRSALLSAVGIAGTFYVGARRQDGMKDDESLDELVGKIQQEDHQRFRKWNELHSEERLSTFTASEMSLISDFPTVAKEIDGKLFDVRVRGFTLPYGIERFIQATSDLHFLNQIVRKH